MHERETPGLPLGWVKLGEASQVLRALAAAYGVPRCDDITRCGDGGCGRRTAIQARTDGGPMLDWQKDTICYKHVGELAIQADVYRVPGRTWQPVIVWIHGGALIAGNREAIAPWQVELYLQAGFCLVSIDYRLAPETKLPEIIADLRDAIRWVRRCGPGLFGLDPERLAVIGHSAGGYLTLWCDSDTNTAGLHTMFGLDADGDEIFLLSGGAIVDSLAFGPQAPDVSLGRIVNGTGSSSCHDTIGSPPETAVRP